MNNLQHMSLNWSSETLNKWRWNANDTTFVLFTSKTAGSRTDNKINPPKKSFGKRHVVTSPASCATSCAMPTTEESNHSAVGMLHPHHRAPCILYVTLHCPIIPSQKNPLTGDINSQSSHTHTHTHNRFTAVWILYGTTRVSQYQNKHLPTHTYHGHQSSLLLHPSNAIHGILPVQFMHLTVFTISLQVFFEQPLGLAPSTSYSIHFFTQSLSFFATHAHTITTCFAVVLQILVSLSTLYLEFYLVASCYYHLCLLKCHLIFLFYGQGLTHFHATYYFAYNCCIISLSINDICCCCCCCCYYYYY